MTTLKLTILYTITILALDAIFQRHYEYVNHRCYEVDYLNGKWGYVK